MLPFRGNDSDCSKLSLWPLNQRLPGKWWRGAILFEAGSCVAQVSLKPYSVAKDNLEHLLLLPLSLSAGIAGVSCSWCVQGWRSDLTPGRIQQAFANQGGRKVCKEEPGQQEVAIGH